MTIRVRLETEQRCTVRESPSRWRRWIGAVERDYEAELRGRDWIDALTGKPVSRAVAAEIEAEFQRACVGDRLRVLRGGR